MPDTTNPPSTPAQPLGPGWTIGSRTARASPPALTELPSPPADGLSNPAEPTTLRTRLLAMGELRDATLFVATAIYVLGYSTWAIYSARRGLGVLPPLEGQYFLAGIFPFVLLLVGTWVVRAISPAAAEVDRKRALHNGYSVTGLAMSAMSLARLSESVSLRLGVVGTIVGIFIVFFLNCLAIALFVRAGVKRLLWPFRLLVTVILLASGYLYSLLMFPLIPRELGGPSPSCVLVDITGNAVAPATAKDLGLAELPSRDVAVRSAPLLLHFDGGGLLVVSPAAGAARNVIRLRSSDIGAVLASSKCWNKSP